MSFFNRLLGKTDHNSSSTTTSTSTSSSSKPTTLKDQCRQWTRDLHKQHRLLERQRNEIAREEAKLKLQIKQSAKKNDLNSVKVMAKSIVQSHKASDRLLEAQTRINSVIYQLQSIQATNTVVGQMGKSTEIMGQMSKLMNLAEIRETTQNMQKEMTRAGIIDEMVQSTFDDLDEPNTETEAEQAVDQVMYEVTAGQMGALPTSTKDRSLQQQQAQKVDNPTDIAEMKAMLENKT